MFIPHAMRETAAKAMQATIQMPTMMTPRQEARRERAEDYAHAVMTGGVPGYWNSDHYRETQNFRGWPYVAIHCAARLMGQATVTIYDKPKIRPSFGGIGGMKSLVPDAPSVAEEPSPDHHLARLMARPNPFFHGQMFRYQIGQQMRLTGGCLIWEVRNVFDIPVQLWVIPRAWCQFQPATPTYPEGCYRVQPISNWVGNMYFNIPSMADFWLDSRLVIRIGWSDPLYPGEFTSPMSACSMMIDIGDEVDKATYSAMQNQVRPSIHIDMSIGGQDNVDIVQAEIDRIRAQMDARHAGGFNNGRPLLTTNSKITEMGTSPSELDYINGRNQSRDAAFGIQGMSPTVAGVTDATAYAALVATHKQSTEGIQCDLDLIAGAFTHRFQTIWPDCRVAMDAKNFDDPMTNLAYTNAKIQSAAYTIDEIRAEFGDGPSDDPEYGKTIAGKPPAPEEEEDTDDPLAFADEDESKDDGDPTDAMTDEPSDNRLSGITRPDLSKFSGMTLAGLNGTH